MDLDKKRERQRRWLRSRREAGIKLLGGCCVDCGSTDDLEFDHVDPSTKLYTMAKIWSYKSDIRLAELAKCVLRCKEDHLARSIQQTKARAVAKKQKV